MRDNKIILITGGSRSGKSRMALEKIAPYPRKLFVATAVAMDEEMKKRIEKHQRERGIDFITVEEPIHLASVLRPHAGQVDAILVDCLTFWLNNLFHYFGGDVAGESHRPAEEIENLLKVLDEKPTTLILVTNEINMGVIPADPLTRHFIAEQGRLNQEIARRSDEVILMISGIPQILKGISEGDYARIP